MYYREYDIDSINLSKYNPPIRTEKGINGLLKNISENGLLQPILVDKNMTVIDGHRRMACLKKLGFSEVPVIQIQEEVKHDDLFLATCSDTMALNGNQHLWRYMQGMKVPKGHFKRIKHIEEWIGVMRAHGLFRRLIEEGRSHGTYEYAMSLYRDYTGRTNKKEMTKLVYYMLNVDAPTHVKSAIMNFIPAEVLKECIDTKSKISFEFSVGG
tara:strand:- start:363 stop:998 length:636 start_codon:yes stop_codon:yes gene_type:complete